MTLPFLLEQFLVIIVFSNGMTLTMESEPMKEAPGITIHPLEVLRGLLPPRMLARSHHTSAKRER